MGSLDCLLMSVSVQIPLDSKTVCFQWYLPRYQSIWAVPYQGWSVQIHPVRSTVLAPARICSPDHAFTTRTEAVDSTPDPSFFGGCSACCFASLVGPLRTRNVGATSLACGVFRKSWKSRSFEKT